VSIRITDSGPGIPAGKKLFQPLQKGADATGLGLYLSRAFMRSFRGDLRHDPSDAGCCFVLDLVAASATEEPVAEEHPLAIEHASDTTLTA
jgi:signal transduction histidine kinase